MFAGLNRSIWPVSRLFCLLPDTTRRYLQTRVKNLQSQQTSIDDSDIINFSKLSSEWTKEDGSFKALYSMNRLRLPLIVGAIGQHFSQGKDPLANLRIVDIGCGGGILTFPLARLGAKVIALDASENVITSIKESENCFKIENRGTGEAVFQCSSIEDFAAKKRGAFDAVIASEILEHVSDVEFFVESCVQLVRSGGALFFTTINKTILSRIMAVWMAERILGIVPLGVHDWSKFIDPESLRMILEENGCSVHLIHGMIYNPLNNRWSWSSNTSVNYALVAFKN